MDKQRINKEDLFDRPDADRIDTIENANGIIISAKKRDSSILNALLKSHRADHGHEAAANTYLDWQLGYLATGGTKLMKYDERRNFGTADAEKSSKYLRLIRKLGQQDQRLIEFCIDPENTLFAQYLDHIEKHGLEQATHLSDAMTIMLDTGFKALDRLARAISRVNQDTEDELKHLEQLTEAGLPQGEIDAHMIEWRKKMLASQGQPC